MVKKLRKLALSKETVRQLEARELGGGWVAGGSTNDLCVTQAISCGCSAPRTCTVAPNC